jgi:hypothetical protein
MAVTSSTASMALFDSKKIGRYKANEKMVALSQSLNSVRIKNPLLAIG